VTPTASGKSLCFNLPVVDHCIRWPRTRAVYFYQTKALANDQKAALDRLLAHLATPPTVAVFHGDLDHDERQIVLEDPPNILLATPDILHHQQLPKHDRWRRWWAGLMFVVIDEAHAYRGVFGSHIAHVVRRIRRVAGLYGSDPQFFAASATIGNPRWHLGELTGRDPVVIDEDGSPQSQRDVAIVSAPLDDKGVPVRSTPAEGARLIAAALRAEYSTIGFARSRRSVERIRRQVDADLRSSGRADLEGSVEGYRAGLSRVRRLAIERGLRSGSIKGVVATVALELGVDIGSLDVAVLAGYPGSVMGFRQQTGRAGRRDRPALVVMVASQNPLDQYFAEHPDELLDGRPEDAAVDLMNPYIAGGQLGCAARERSLGSEDRSHYGDQMGQVASLMCQHGQLRDSAGTYVAVAATPRPIDVDLRSMGERSYLLLVGDREIGSIEERYVPREAHPGAIYLHDGMAYRVIGVSRTTGEITLKRSDEGVLTEPKGARFIELLSREQERQFLDGAVSVTHGRLFVTTEYDEYVEIDEDTGHLRSGEIPIEPPQHFELRTSGLQLRPGPGVSTTALHGLEHMIRSLAPVTILCDRADLEGHTDPGEWVAYVYDRHEGGVGLSERLMERFDDVLAVVAGKLRACPCAAGCPSCIQSGACLLENDALSKSATLSLLGPVAARPSGQIDERVRWPTRVASPPSGVVAPPAADTGSAPMRRATTGQSTLRGRRPKPKCPYCLKEFRKESGLQWHREHFNH
jgi:DEAD/DEAH box helicase domain-containing protein